MVKQNIPFSCTQEDNISRKSPLVIEVSSDRDDDLSDDCNKNDINWRDILINWNLFGGKTNDKQPRPSSLGGIIDNKILINSYDIVFQQVTDAVELQAYQQVILVFLFFFS